MVNFIRKLLADRTLTERKSIWTLKIIATELPYWLPTKICTYLMLAFHIPVYAIQLVYVCNFIQKRQFNEMIAAGPQVSVTLFALVAAFSMIRVENPVKTCLNEIQSRPYARIDSKIEQEVDNDSRYVLNVFTLMGAATVVPFLGLSPFYPGSSKYLLFYRICEDIWSEQLNVQLFFKFTYWFTFPLAGFILICPALILHFVVLRCKAHVRMIGKGFEHMNRGYRGIDHVALRHSRGYQRVMYERLKQLVKDTIYIKRSTNKCLDKVQPVVMGIFGVGPLIEISVIIFVMNDMENTDSAKWADFLVGISAACGISLFWQVCQQMIDESGALVDYAAKCPWNMWDSRNRKTLLMYLINNRKPLQITVGGLFVVNYPLCIQYVRTTYSFSILFFKIRN